MGIEVACDGRIIGDVDDFCGDFACVMTDCVARGCIDIGELKPLVASQLDSE